MHPGRGVRDDATDGEMLAVIVATAGALLAGGILLLRMCQTSDC